ncbi:MAG TPA: class I SAM-dependent methyltransferase [Allosphingosinicella sp.]|jgi:SAM-dependent methyltransferase
MRSPETWKPSKFVMRGGRLAPSRDRSQVDVGSRLMVALIADRYQRALPRHARGRLLDMGCGSVPLYGAYRDHVTEVTCIDWANGAHGNHHLDRECDLSAPLPFADGSFDTILLSDVLEHLPDPRHCWSEAARLLAPGGKLILNVPFYYQVHEEPHDYFRYTEFALRRFAADAGFDVVELTAVGGAPEIVVDIIAKLLTKLPLGAGPAAVLQWVAGRAGRSRLGGRLSRMTQFRFPLAYFMVAAVPGDRA